MYSNNLIPKKTWKRRVPREARGMVLIPYRWWIEQSYWIQNDRVHRDEENKPEGGWDVDENNKSWASGWCKLSISFEQLYLLKRECCTCTIRNSSENRESCNQSVNSTDPKQANHRLYMFTYIGKGIVPIPAVQPRDKNNVLLSFMFVVWIHTKYLFWFNSYFETFLIALFWCNKNSKLL